ncbi:MAG: phycobilisome rod-core linker polypeptide [Cyanobacteriota bacterium]|nr:phycobilisome rod-core linker polypeptide [Cyanobacteriota bacterium]MEC8607468.1 phycobilisome rod-core linker polypeptide [Cyanobacteriota bacterium]
MSVTASSGSPRVSPQLYDTLPLSSVRQAEQQDRFPDRGELDNLINFFQSGQSRVQASRVLSANAQLIVARAANRIFVGGTPLSFLDEPLAPTTSQQGEDRLAADQQAFASSVETFVQGSGGGGFLGRIREGFSTPADVRILIPAGFTPINISRYGNERMRKSVRDLGWFVRYVGYALVAGDPSILRVNARGLRDILEKGCSLPATNLALQEMRAASAALFEVGSEERNLVIACFNVLIEELAVATPSARQRPGNPQQQGLQLPAIYALAAEGPQRFVIKPNLSGVEKAEIIRAAYRQVFQRDIAKAYSQAPCQVEASQVAQGQISMREFIRALGRSKEYRQQFFSRFANTRAVELAFRHFLGRGVSSLEEFRKYFSIVSEQGLNGLVDSLVNSMEYARVFGEETVPYLRDLGEEAQESAGWGSNRKLFRFSAPFDGAPQYLTLYASYRQPLADQHAYGGGNDPLALSYGAIFPSPTASVRTRPAPYGYSARRLMVGNGLNLSGQINGPTFNSTKPRKVGPRVVSMPSTANDGRRPDVNEAAKTVQAVIRAAYAQIIGNSGYAGEQQASAESRLANGEICLKEFIRLIARSKAFQKRYWDGLYITKAIEVMHRRLLGRPTFGRWEIDAYFDTAARKGFFGVVDALIDSEEYQTAFGDDTVPFERFITAFDVNSRRVPSFRPALDTSSLPSDVGQPSVSRPEPAAKNELRTPGSTVQRNLQRRDTTASFGALPQNQNAGFQPVRLRGGVDNIDGPTSPAVMTRVLSGSRPEALRRRESVGYVPLELSDNATESELQTVIEAVYRQLLNRMPFDAERCSEIESQLRNGSLTVSGFVAGVAASELYQQRLSNVPPLLAAATAHLTLLGRSPKPEEISSFIRQRAEEGQRSATQALLDSSDYNDAFGRQTVPYPIGLTTQGGYPLLSLNSTASLVQPKAGQTPPQRPVISTRGQRNRVGQEGPAIPAQAKSKLPSLSLKGRKAGFSSRVSQFRSQPTKTLVSSRAPMAFGGGRSAKAPTSAVTMLGLMTGAVPQALRAGAAELPAPLRLVDNPSESELQEVIAAAYQQLIDRIPCDTERLLEAEAQLRSGTTGVVDFVAEIASSDLFQERLHALPPLQAAAAAHLALLGRAPLPEEISGFVINRAEKGQVQAVADLIESDTYDNSFGRNMVPGPIGVASQAGVPLISLNQTARMAQGKAGLNPAPSDGAI